MTRPPFRIASLVAIALALAAGFAWGAVAPAPAAAQCDPGRLGQNPPRGCRAPGGEPARALPDPAAAATGGRRPRFHLTDPCEQVAAWAPVHRQSRHGIELRFFWVWVEDGRAPHPFALVCGNLRSVPGTSRGPGAEGASLPCPTIEPFGRTRPDSVGWWVGSRAAYTHVDGGVGANRDGFWGFRFYNPHATPVRARLFATCRMPAPGHR